MISIFYKKNNGMQIAYIVLSLNSLTFIFVRFILMSYIIMRNNERRSNVWSCFPFLVSRLCFAHLEYVYTHNLWFEVKPIRYLIENWFCVYSLNFSSFRFVKKIVSWFCTNDQLSNIILIPISSFSRYAVFFSFGPLSILNAH